MIIVGIDPGKSTGVAVYRDGELVHMRTVQPQDLPALLDLYEPRAVIYEDSRLQSPTWARAVSPAAMRKIARNVGQVDALCTSLVHTCAQRSIAALGISPKRKGAKLNAAQFGAATGWEKRSNQHERDAAMVAWPYRRGGLF